MAKDPRGLNQVRQASVELDWGKGAQIDLLEAEKR